MTEYTKDAIPQGNTQGQDDKEEDFLSRWSRRKREAQQVCGDVDSIQETTNKTNEPVKYLTDADMPPLESLTEESDYSGFFSPKVSEELRKLALRKLFHSAGFNIRDGLDDYDEDFTKFVPLGDIITADVKHRFEKEMQAKDNAAPEANAESTTSVDQQDTLAQTDCTETADDELDAEEKTT